PPRVVMMSAAGDHTRARRLVEGSVMRAAAVRLAAAFVMTGPVVACDTELPPGAAIIESRDFGKVFVGDSVTRTLRLTNDIVPGTTLVISSSVLDPGTVFSRIGSQPPPTDSVRPGGTPRAFVFGFQPPQVGPFRTNWRLTLNGQPVVLELMGTGVLVAGDSLREDAGQTSDASGYDFRSVIVRTRAQVLLRFDAIGGVVITRPTIDQSVPGVFQLLNAATAPQGGPVPDPPSTRSLSRGQELVVTLSFTPLDAIRYTGTLTVRDNNGNVAYKLFLQGDGEIPREQ
ncbi:MAG: hypothetical protein ACT4P7_11255, partial [Gemmatimonadaceae bacterium]